MNKLDNVKIKIRGLIAIGAFAVGISAAACVPVTNRVVYKDSYKVDNVLHLSKKYSDTFTVNFVGWSYKWGDYTCIDSVVFFNDHQSKLNELEDGDTLVKKLRQKATVFDLGYCLLLKHPVSSFFERILEYDVIKNLDDLVPLDVI
jgi:hypothetical protein